MNERMVDQSMHSEETDFDIVVKTVPKITTIYWSKFNKK